MGMKRTHFERIDTSSKPIIYSSTKDASVSAGNTGFTADAFNTTDIGSDTLFADSDRTLYMTLSGTNRYRGAHSVSTKSTGKYYIEIDTIEAFPGANYYGVIADADFSPTTSLPGGNSFTGLYGGNRSPKTRSYVASNTLVQVPLNTNGGWSSSADTTDGDVIQLAIDLDNGFLHFGINGSWASDPTLFHQAPSRNYEKTHSFGVTARGVEVYFYMMIRGGNDYTEGKHTINFGQSAFTYDVPGGYTPGWPA